MPPIYPGSNDFRPSFLATSEIYALSPEGRSTLPKNGIRWNTAAISEVLALGLYKTMQYSTWPIFVDHQDNPIEGLLETEVQYRTYLYPLSENSFADWMIEGAEFFFMEGGKRVGQGQIISKVSP